MNIVTIGGRVIDNTYKYEDKNYISLRYMIYALEGITHEENEKLPPREQRVVWNSADKIAIFRITDRMTGEKKVIQFSTAGLQNDTKPTPREVTINGAPAGKIDFVYHNDLNMIGIRELSRLAGLECYLQWYTKDGNQYADLRLDDPLYGYGGRKAAVDAIVANQAVFPESPSGEYYQVLYGTADQGGKINRYSGYTFTEMDALQWLIQTGGNISFAVQIRDTVRLTGYTSQVQTAVNNVWAIMLHFIRAEEVLRQYGYGVKTPTFFIGTPEENVDVSFYSTDGMIAIYRGIVEKLRLAGISGAVTKRMLGGIYFGSEAAKGGGHIDFDRMRKAMAAEEGKILWIPYFISREELSAIRRAAVHFDKVILQPSTFYMKDTYYQRNDDYTGYAGYLGDSAKWDDILALLDGTEDKEKFGVELEFDMGLLSGRGDRQPPLSPQDKIKAFKDYIDKIIPRIGKTPIGIYSGGPNEQGYNNIIRNNNLHNNENHPPYRPVTPGFGTGSQYSDLYEGNLIHKINSILFANKTNQWKKSELNIVMAGLDRMVGTV